MVRPGSYSFAVTYISHSKSRVVKVLLDLCFNALAKQNRREGKSEPTDICATCRPMSKNVINWKAISRKPS